MVTDIEDVRIQNKTAGTIRDEATAQREAP
jgi:hypothetical protein